MLTSKNGPLFRGGRVKKMRHKQAEQNRKDNQEKRDFVIISESVSTNMADTRIFLNNLESLLHCLSNIIVMAHL